MDNSELAQFFAQQEATLGDGVEQPASNQTQEDHDKDQTEFNEWMTEQFGPDTHAAGGQPVPAGNAQDGQGAPSGPSFIVSGGEGGYSPSAVPFEHQERAYSPSAIPAGAGGYSPSNVQLALPGGADDDVEGSEMQESRQGSQEMRDTSMLSEQHSGMQSVFASVPEPSAGVQPPLPGSGTPISTAYAQQDSNSGRLETLRLSSQPPGLPDISRAPSVPVQLPRAPNQTQAIPSSPYEAAKLRTQTNRHDHAAWREYLTLAENSAELEKIKEAYEDALRMYPNTASIQIAYLNHFLTPPLFREAEGLFARFLRPSPSVELWKFYLTYVRRINTNTSSDATVRDNVRKAYEFALSHVGHDMDAGQIWRDYIDFLKNNLEAKTTWDAQQKMDALRSAYHRAVVIPLENVESLWRELDQYENGLNKITAKKFLADLSPGYMTAKTALKDLRRLLGPIATPTPATANPPSTFNFPPAPVWSEIDRKLVAAWKDYLKWEESNPLVENPATLHTRILSAYRKAVARMRFFPDIIFLAYHQLAALGKNEEALATLKQGVESSPASFVLSFAYAEHLEVQKSFPEVHAVFDALITTLHADLDTLEAEINSEVEAARQSVFRGDLDEASAPVVVEAEDRARKVRERRSKDLESAKSELGVVWIMLMRFARRSEGLKPARNVFAKARKAKWCAWNVYEAAALMEYHCTKAPDVATKIFEIGLKQFNDNIEFVTRYLAFLITINDDNNARALFERTITAFPGESGRLLWERWARYEYNFSDFAATQKLGQRIIEALPNDPPIKQFAYKYTYLNVDAIASRDLGFGAAPPKPSVAPAREASPPPSQQQTQTPTLLNGSGSKRAPSLTRRREPSPPSKRFKGNSPPPGPRGRDWERDRGGKGRGHSPRRENRRDIDAVPEGVSWFLGTLPSATAFDGPKFRTDDLMHLFKTANLPLPPGPDPRRSRSPPPRAGRPPPDYGPYQGPGGGSRGGRRY